GCESLICESLRRSALRKAEPSGATVLGGSVQERELGSTHREPRLRRQASGVQELLPALGKLPVLDHRCRELVGCGIAPLGNVSDLGIEGGRFACGFLASPAAPLLPLNLRSPVLLAPCKR